MRYSVWNHGTRRYDYYEAPGDTGTHAGAPPRVRTNDLGAAPEQAAWPLPVASVKVGSGANPQGRIASLGASDAGLFKINLPRSVMYAALGYLIWKVTR